ncbi:hypothetical protein SAVIM40S_03498 [Streptomyces avidinii]|uniref:Uncharacterized protein n=1 Tax=Streptomyces avidinii TaxID=1895 RepID=A0ABS4L0H7_STRAV|nr:hypothetical protein [Streptomyces avidinii]
MRPSDYHCDHDLREQREDRCRLDAMSALIVDLVEDYGGR